MFFNVRPPISRQTHTSVLFTVPSIPCTDFSGRVLRVGSSVSKVAVGDYVAGFSQGSAAHFCVAAETNVVKLSSRDNLKTACAAGVVTLTASECLRKGDVTAGSTVVVIGASGGVGHILVQMAKNLGACVIAVCRCASCIFHPRACHVRRQYLQRTVREGPWRRHHTPIRCWAQL